MTDYLPLPASAPSRNGDDFELLPAMSAPVGAANIEPVTGNIGTSPSPAAGVERTGHVGPSPPLRSPTLNNPNPEIRGPAGGPRRGRGSCRRSTPSLTASSLLAGRGVGSSGGPPRSGAGEHNPWPELFAQHERDPRVERRSSGSSPAETTDRGRGRGGLSGRGAHSATPSIVTATPPRTNSRPPVRSLPPPSFPPTPTLSLLSSGQNPPQASPVGSPTGARPPVFEPIRWGNTNFQFGASPIAGSSNENGGASQRRIARVCTRRGASPSPISRRSSNARPTPSAIVNLPVGHSTQPSAATMPPPAGLPRLPSVRPIASAIVNRPVGHPTQSSAATISPPAGLPRFRPIASATVNLPVGHPTRPSAVPIPLPVRPPLPPSALVLGDLAPPAATIQSPARLPRLPSARPTPRAIPGLVLGDLAQPPAATIQPPADLPRPPASITQLAEDASVLLELISKTKPEELNGDYWQIIDSVFSSVLKIRTGLRPGRTSDDESYGEIEGSTVDSSCIICYARIADAVLMPCKHLVLCVACYGKMKMGQAEAGVVQCPICRSGVTYTIAIFRG